MTNSVRRLLLVALAATTLIASPSLDVRSSAAPAVPSNSLPALGGYRVDAPIGPLDLVVDRRGGGNVQQPSISANGRYITYTSKDTRGVGLEPNDATQVFRYDRRTGDTALVTVTPDGFPGGEDSTHGAMSADGQVVVFVTRAGDLLPGSPLITRYVVAARDMETGETSLVSRTPSGDQPSENSVRPLVTHDGSLVFFETAATDITGVAGAVIYDRSSETSSPVTVEAGADVITPKFAWPSGDGDWIVFDSTNSGVVVGDDNDASDVFLMHRATGEVTLISRTADGTVANRSSRFNDGWDFTDNSKPVVSADGSTVVFISGATDLAGAEHAGVPVWDQVYAFDVATGRSELVTAMPDGSLAEDWFHKASISPDGRYVAVRTQADLAGPYGPGGMKVFVRDLKRGQTRAASSYQSATSAVLGGRRPQVVFSSVNRLVPEDTDRAYDVYLRRVW